SPALPSAESAPRPLRTRDRHRQPPAGRGRVHRPRRPSNSCAALRCPPTSQRISAACAGCAVPQGVLLPWSVLSECDQRIFPLPEFWSVVLSQELVYLAPEHRSNGPGPAVDPHVLDLRGAIEPEDRSHLKGMAMDP